MKALVKYTWTEIKLYLREPMGAFFTLVFPLMMLFLFGSIYGNEPSALFNGYGSVDVSVPAYTAMIIGMLLLILAGKLVYNLRFDGNALNVTLAFVLSSLSFFSLGFVLASIMPNARTAQVVGMVIFYPMLFLSGAGMPLEILPQTVRNLSKFLPLTHVVTLLRGLWTGEVWSQHITEVWVLLAVLAAGVLISAKTFRWE
jgi:ABC-2 type transport system permease protein